ncbi:hypothetical protein KHQ81_07915 [Mycoplasmatota bacterium]|nr:hypothetical protein KHQ81_07915 [Mycoplasmatota bacterium]
MNKYVLLIITFIMIYTSYTYLNSKINLENNQIIKDSFEEEQINKLSLETDIIKDTIYFEKDFLKGFYNEKQFAFEVNYLKIKDILKIEKD